MFGCVLLCAWIPDYYTQEIFFHKYGCIIKRIYLEISRSIYIMLEKGSSFCVVKISHN